MHEHVEREAVTDAPAERVVTERVAAPTVASGPARTGSGLVVGAVDDPAERSADATADAVIAYLCRADRSDVTTRVHRMAQTPTAPSEPRGGPQIQRSAVAIRREDAPPSTDPEADPDGEDVPLSEDEAAATGDEGGGAEGIARSMGRVRRSTMGAAAPGHGAAGGPAEPDTERRIQRSRGGGTPLDDATRRRMERGFGADLSGVKVHAGTESNTLNRSLNARAFTVGNDIFFGEGEYRPGAASGERLLAHELAHVVAEPGGARRAVRRQTVIRRRFAPAVTASKAHLRQQGTWGTFHGPGIARGSRLLVDNNDANAVLQTRSVLANVTWRPAINITPETQGAVANNLQGYIRSTRALFAPSTLERSYRREISDILTAAENRIQGGYLTGKLLKGDHVDFLVDKALRYETWNPDKPTIPGFTTGLATKQAKIDRIQEGAEHVADSLEHWRKWLHPTQSDAVRIHKVKFKKSDLHEHGLGVLDVEFRKPLGGAAKFSADKTVKTIIKPEDKSLEKALLGSEATSAASQINQLAGLNAGQSLATVKMEVANIGGEGEEVFTTLVEKVAGISSEDLVGGDKSLKSKGTFATQPSFHETLVFAFLAGIDDLHWENVMWVNDKPYLIDADTVMTHAQMAKTGPGDFNQSGFSTVNKDEATANKEAIKANDPVAARSRILDMMVNNPGVRAQIIAALRGAITGKKGRTVPISTDRWGKTLNSYQTEQNRDGFLDFYSSRAFLVRENKPFDGGFGAGLAGTTGVNVANGFYSQPVERAQLKADLDAGQLPFYEYEYGTGFVTHNGQKVFHGMTLDQAMTTLAARY